MLCKALRGYLCESVCVPEIVASKLELCKAGYLWRNYMSTGKPGLQAKATQGYPCEATWVLEILASKQKHDKAVRGHLCEAI